MRGTFIVAIVLLVAAGGQTAAGFDQDEPQHAFDDDFMASVDIVNKMMQSRLLRASRDLKNDSMFSAGDAKRTPLPPSKFLTKVNAPDSMENAAHALRMGGEAKAIEAASKNLNQIESNKRQRIDLTVAGHVGRTPPNSDKALVSVTSEKSLILAERLKTKRPTAIMENAASFVKQQYSRLAPPQSSTINAKAPADRLENQLITQKASQLDKNDHVDDSIWREELVSVNKLMQLFDEFDKSAHPTIVDYQKESASEVTPESLNQLKSNTHQRVAPEEVHVPPGLDKFSVLVANDLRFVLAKRLMTTSPTAIMNNAAKFVMQHFNRLAQLESSFKKAKAPSGQLNNQPITQKALQLDKNQHVDNVENLLKQDSHTDEHLLHLSEGNDKSAHPTAVSRQTVPIDWIAEYETGPKILPKDALNYEVIAIHKAFLEAFHLPFHLYPQETAIMLRLVRRYRKSSPNNVETYKTLKLMALHQKEASHLRILLDPDLKKFLGVEEMVHSNNLKKLREAFNVKLVILYDLFFEFCHERKDLVKGLPSKHMPSNWILMLLTSSSGDKNH
uniref:Putative RxLR effector n=1 Tax=Plasmopara viticola TaxID=143451 RepID=A0A650F639_PLAVT|nr:putative RxLR effector [Plasmopara viticola]